MISPDVSVQYVMDYLREEFRRHPDVRVRKFSEDGVEGISIKTSSRDYFCPLEWAENEDFAAIKALVREIRDGLKDFD